MCVYIWQIKLILIKLTLLTASCDLPPTLDLDPSKLAGFSISIHCSAEEVFMASSHA